MLYVIIDDLDHLSAESDSRETRYIRRYQAYSKIADTCMKPNSSLLFTPEYEYCG